MNELLEKVDELCEEYQDTADKLMDIRQTLESGKELDSTQKAFLKAEFEMEV